MCLLRITYFFIGMFHLQLMDTEAAWSVRANLFLTLYLENWLFRIAMKLTFK